MIFSSKDKSGILEINHELKSTLAGNGKGCQIRNRMLSWEK